MSLFASSENENLRGVQPLAARMRPRSLAEFCGQGHFLGAGKLLTRLLAADRLGSVIFYGPPGTGKTTLARLLANATDSHYERLSAVTSGVKEVREILQRAEDEIRGGGPRTLLFVDEIHRFNRAQQDVLLHDVEDGVVILVGATTANPFFAVNRRSSAAARFSSFSHWRRTRSPRCCGGPWRTSREVWVTCRSKSMRPRSKPWPRCVTAMRDERSNTLEIAVLSSSERPVRLTANLIRESMQRKAIEYDIAGDSHYDAASALIKSIRGSDPDAGMYWLARMLEGGEDVRFLTRRLVILASEDIGNADPQALPLAVAGMQACEFVGLPECRLTLAQLVSYLACAPKSNAATIAIDEATRDVREGRLLPVPVHLRDCALRGCPNPRARCRIRIFPRRPGWRGQPGLPGRGTAVLPAGGAWCRAGDRAAAGRGAAKAGGSTKPG